MTQDTTELVDQARRRAEQILLANGSDLGLLAARSAYRQVWARDSMIGGLGLLLCEISEGRAIHQRSLGTLEQFQSSLGRIPHNVGLTNVADPALIAQGGRLRAGDAAAVAVADTTHAGAVDGTLWYIIGRYCDYVVRRDKDDLRRVWTGLEQALLWLRYQDSNECGLLEVHESMDWADLFANRYNVLYDNVLYYAAWRSMSELADALGLPAESYREHAADVRKKINLLLWVGPKGPADWEYISRERQEWLYPIHRVETELVERPFYLPYLAFRDYADRFDTFGNVLAILFGVADRAKADRILDYIHGCGLNEPHPVRVLYPTVRPGDKDWRDYYRVRNLNPPDHYHNGGAWPFIGGFYVAALVRAGRQEEASRQLEKLAHMNRLGREGEWEFNEWFHGSSGRPMGFAGQSWSAAMYIYAHDAVTHGAVRLFGDWENA